MIRLSVMYPRTEGTRFDLDYWVDKHIPMIQAHCGDSLRAAAVDAGLAGGMAGEPSAFYGSAHLTFESLESMNAALAPHLAETMGDLPNYTDTAPMIEVSVVKL